MNKSESESSLEEMVKRMKWMGGGDLVVSSSGHDFLFEVKEINGCFIDAGQL